MADEYRLLGVQQILSTCRSLVLIWVSLLFTEIPRYSINLRIGYLFKTNSKNNEFCNKFV